MDWPIATILIVVNICVWAGVCFLRWLRFQREMELDHHALQRQAFALEERKFALEEQKFGVWKTAQLAHTAQNGEHARRIVQQAMRVPTPAPEGMGNVIPFGNKREASPVDDERAEQLMAIIEEASTMDEDEARAFLASHGIENVAVFRAEDDPIEPKTT